MRAGVKWTIAALYVMCGGACGGEFSASSPNDLSQGDSSSIETLDASVTGSGGSTGSEEARVEPVGPRVARTSLAPGVYPP